MTWGQGRPYNRHGPSQRWFCKAKIRQWSEVGDCVLRSPLWTLQCGWERKHKGQLIRQRRIRVSLCTTRERTVGGDLDDSLTWEHSVLEGHPQPLEQGMG